MKKALLIHPADNVAVVTEDTAAGEQIEISGSVPRLRRVERRAGLESICENEKTVLTAAEKIPIYHKIALKTLQTGEAVVKYGEIIGRAVCDIPKGCHVHCHNTESPEKGGE